MAQSMRPISTVTDQGNFTGASAHGSVDGTAPDTGDYWNGNDNETDVLEVLLTDLSGSTPDTGTCTVVIYQAQSDTNSAPSSSGSAPTYDLEVYEGTTQRAAATGLTPTESTFTLYNSLTFSSSVITDWSNVRVRFTSYGTGGSPGGRRGAAVSYIEISTPDAGTTPTAITGSGAITFADASTTIAGATPSFAGSAAIAFTDPATDLTPSIGVILGSAAITVTDPSTTIEDINVGPDLIVGSTAITFADPSTVISGTTPSFAGSTALTSGDVADITPSVGSIRGYAVPAFGSLADITPSIGDIAGSAAITSGDLAKFNRVRYGPKGKGLGGGAGLAVSGGASWR